MAAMQSGGDEHQGSIIKQNMFRTEEALVLASASPRRQNFLESLGIEFRVFTADIDENPLPSEKPEQYVSRMAKDKALKVMKNFPESWVIAADTIVSIDDMVLGKPADMDDAVQTLMLLCGRDHMVTTSFFIGSLKKQKHIQESVKTTVTFTDFNIRTARAYAGSGEPLDKAGAYGVQGLGAALVRKIEGSYTNVVGLPLAETLKVMIQLGIVSIHQE